MSPLPTLIVLATVNPKHLRLVLSEVESFSWVNLATDGCLEVFIRNFPVLISIKLVKQVLELLVCESQAPVLEVEPQLFRCDGP